MISSALVSRSYSPADLQAVTDLLNLCDQTYKLEDGYTPENLATEFSHPRVRVEKDLRLWENESGQLLGFGQMWRNEPQDGHISAYMFLRVHPDFEKSGVGEEITAWAADWMRQESKEVNLPGIIDTGERDFYSYNLATFEKSGFSVVRYFFRMRRDLSQPIPAVDLPAGYTLSNVKTKEDAVKWVEAFNQSFIDHWNFHPSTEADHLHHLTESHYRPENDLVAVAPDGTFGGFCFCVIDPAEIERTGEKRGWIGTLGTTRTHRRVGLGRAMLLAGMHHLKKQGMEVALLGVDAENPSGALSFYERYGFVKAYTNVGYRKEVDGRPTA